MRHRETVGRKGSEAGRLSYPGEGSFLWRDSQREKKKLQRKRS